MTLNDKLINYEDISTFHSNLLNDSSVSVKAAWSSSKIKSYVDASLDNKANTSDLDIYIKFASLSQTDYNLLPVKDVSTLYLTNDRNINYAYIGNILIGGTEAVAISSTRLQYMTTDS